MKYEYDVIDIFYEKNKNMYLIPTGEFLPFGGDIEMNHVFEIALPATIETLEKNIFDCFALCWTETETKIRNEPSVIEKHLGIRGFKKIVEKFDFLRIKYNKPSKQYELWYDFNKEKNHYSNCKFFNFGEKIDFEHIKNIVQDN